MEIKRGHMIPLGYGKFWRSDDIVGLMPIENGRGPGRRTEVYVASLDEPLIASRGQRTILDDMAHAGPDARRTARLREAIAELVDAFGEITPAQRLILGSEARFDVARWEQELNELLTARDESDEPDAQGDLFG